MSQKHLSDDRLIEICVTESVSPTDDAHLVACGDCDLRRLEIAQMLDEIDRAASTDADKAFPDDKLARQYGRILQRAEQEGRPGRLLSFPAAQATPSMALRSRPHARWAAAATAAAFVMGVLAGHLAHKLPSTSSPESASLRIVANERDATPLRAVSTTWSEEEFLEQLEQATFRVSPAALGPLDAVTPRGWEVVGN